MKFKLSDYEIAQIICNSLSGRTGLEAIDVVRQEMLSRNFMNQATDLQTTLASQYPDSLAHFIFLATEPSPSNNTEATPVEAAPLTDSLLSAIEVVSQAALPSMLQEQKALAEIIKQILFELIQVFIADTPEAKPKSKDLKEKIARHLERFINALKFVEAEFLQSFMLSGPDSQLTGRDAMHQKLLKPLNSQDVEFLKGLYAIKLSLAAVKKAPLPPKKNAPSYSTLLAKTANAVNDLPKFTTIRKSMRENRDRLIELEKILAPKAAKNSVKPRTKMHVKV